MNQCQFFDDGFCSRFVGGEACCDGCDTHTGRLQSILCDWLDCVPVWWSASGGSQVRIAQAIEDVFGLPVQLAIDAIVDPIAQSLDGFVWDGWDQGFVADAGGFRKFLHRQGW